MNAMAGKIRSGIVALGLALSFYWMFTYSGLFRYFSELQIKYFGSYVPKLTVAGICLLFFLLGELARVLLRGAERPVPGAQVRATRAAATPMEATAAKLTSGLNVEIFRPLLVVGAPFCIGAYFFLLGMNAGPLREVQMADFAGGGLPSHAIFAEVRGYADEQYLAVNNYCYVPLRDSPDPHSPIRVVVGVDEVRMSKEFAAQADGSVVVRGMLEQGPKSEIRYRLEQNGFVMPSQSWILYTKRNPAADQKVGGFLMLASLVIGGIWMARLRRQAPKPRALGAPVGANAGVGRR